MSEIEKIALSGVIIVIAGEKGGVGKSTLTQHLVPYLASTGYNVLLGDADPQASSGVFTTLRKDHPELPTYEYFRVSHDENNPQQSLQDLERINKARDKFDVIVIDVAGNANKLLKLSLIMADVAIFPVDPSGKALNTIPKVIEIVKQVKLKANTSLTVRSVISKGYTGAFANRQAIQTLKQFEKDLPYLDAVTNRRVDVGYANDEGMAVFEQKNNAWKARNEMTKFCEKVVELCA